MITKSFTTNNGDITLTVPLTPEEILTITSTKYNHANLTATFYQGDEPAVVLTLEQAKEIKNASIDTRTRALISNGFQFDNHTWSLSEEAQRNWAGMMGAIGCGILTDANFPMDFSDKNDLSYSLTFANALPFLGTAVGTVKYHKGTGTALKNQVNACLTIAEVDAIIDNR